MERAPLSRRQLLVSTGAGASAVIGGCLEGTQTARQPAGTGSQNETPPAGEAEADDPAPGDLAVVVTVGASDEPAFVPDVLRVHPGAIVRWTWQSDGHNLVPVSRPDAAQWEGVQEPQEAGFQHQHTFEVAGRYEYVCEPHAEEGATGTVIVLEDGIGELQDT